MSAPDFVVAIPARYSSSRLPGKPLALIGGEPMVVQVARRALAAGAGQVWVATDDGRIAQALDGMAGIQVAMTAPGHASGTDRLAECAAIAGWADDTIVVNLQGDEPFAPAAGITAVVKALVEQGTAMATLSTPVEHAQDLFDPNVVKVVRDALGRALYFSRAPMPWPRDAFALDRSVLPPGQHWLRHIGIYAYRAGFLRQFAAMPPGRLEQIESLEQLRVIEAGHAIAVGMSPAPFPPGIDTEQDLLRANAWLAAQ